MRNINFRRHQKLVELTRRIKRCKINYIDDIEYIKRKSDILHSLGSNYWNAFETKRMRNKSQRLLNRKRLKLELINLY